MTKKTIKKKEKIVFMGTPIFAEIILKKLIATKWKPELVITAPDKPMGRKQIITPPPVKILSKKEKIPIIQPVEIIEAQSQLNYLSPDSIIVSAYGKILPKAILDIPRLGCINIHPSLLPKYRGPSPIQTTILNGDKESGVTIILMNQAMDEGPIIAQKKITLKGNETKQTLNEKLAKLGGSLLIKTLPLYFKNKIIPYPQPNIDVSYTRLITKKDGLIYWHKKAEEIERQIRAFNDWPGAYTFLKIKDKKINIKILESEIMPCQNNYQYGTCFYNDRKEWAVQTGKDCLIIKKIQPAGKKLMDAKDFLNGHPDVIGKIFS